MGRGRNNQATTLQSQYAMSHAEIARVLGVTPMRVCQIEKGAMEKLRAEYARRGMRESWLGPRLARKA